MCLSMCQSMGTHLHAHTRMNVHPPAPNTVHGHTHIQTSMGSIMCPRQRLHRRSIGVVVVVVVVVVDAVGRRIRGVWMQFHWVGRQLGSVEQSTCARNASIPLFNFGILDTTPCTSKATLIIVQHNNPCASPDVMMCIVFPLEASEDNKKALISYSRFTPSCMESTYCPTTMEHKHVK